MKNLISNSISNLRRSRGRRRQVSRRVLILCEGETEKNYFQAIKEDPDYKKVLSAIHPQVVTAKNPTPEQVVKEAINRANKASQENNPYDKVWVVFDHDHHPHRQSAYDDAQGAAFGIAFTAIAFELWYLLHFVKSTRTFANGNEFKIALRKHYPNYEKAKQNDFAILKPQLADGINNAVWLRNQMLDESKNVTDHNPWTDVDVLVVELIGDEFTT